MQDSRMQPLLDILALIALVYHSALFSPYFSILICFGSFICSVYNRNIFYIIINVERYKNYHNSFKQIIEIITMNKKQYNKLIKYQESFNQAEHNYYSAMLRTDIDILADIYEELGYSLPSNHRNCSKCILSMLKNLSTEIKTYTNKNGQKTEI